jgi:hypothetical protein
MISVETLALAKKYADGIASDITDISVSDNVITFTNSNGDEFEITLNAVKSAEIDSSSHLIITLSDDSEIDAGAVTFSASGCALDTPIVIGGESQTNAEDALGALQTAKQDTVLSAPLTVNGVSESTVEDALSAINAYADLKLNASEITSKTIYIDAEDGDDSNSGASSDAAVKTVSGAYGKIKCATKLNLVFVSDYTGDLEDTNSLIPVLTVTSDDTNNPVKISGSIKISDKQKVDISFIDVEVTLAEGTDSAVDIKDTSSVNIHDVNINCINTYQTNAGQLIRLENVATSYLEKNVKITKDSSSTQNIDIALALVNSSVMIDSTGNVFSGCRRVVDLKHGSALVTSSTFIDASSSALAKVNRNINGVYVLDGILQDQGMISVDTLKSLTASSTYYQDFVNAVAAL